jgi:hypothetical protein
MSTLRTNAIVDASGGTTATVNGIPLRPGVLDPENRIINGAFDFWQRGTSSTSNGHLADRWYSEFSGGSFSQSRQAFTLGDTFGNNNPSFFLRQSVSGQSTAGQYALTVQNIEGVRNYAGQTITVLGWMRRSSGSGNVAVQCIQDFGTGGSPSSRVFVSPQTVTLTGSWAAFALTFAVPSISGKTLGTNGNDYLQLRFWTSAGSDFNANTNSLGLQTIGVDLWGIHIKQGTHTTSAVNLYRQPELGPELARCQRYCVVYGGNSVYERFGLGINGSTTMTYPIVYTPVDMRANPAVSISSTSHFGVWNGVSISAVVAVVTDAASTKAFSLAVTSGGLTATAPTGFLANNTTAARLTLDAEL